MAHISKLSFTTSGTRVAYAPPLQITEPRVVNFSANGWVGSSQTGNQRGNRTVAEVAESLGIAESMLHSWKRQHDPERSNDRGETPEHELRRLRREVADLKRGRDALANQSPPS